jgi:hypothetical protein
MVVFTPHTLQCTLSFVDATTISGTWHFAHNFQKGGVVTLNIDHIPTI